MNKKNRTKKQNKKSNKSAGFYIDDRDMTGKRCEECGWGTYTETSFFNDMCGTLNCNRCDHVVKRYRSRKEQALEKAVHKSLQNVKNDLGLTYSDLSKMLDCEVKLLKRSSLEGFLPIGDFRDNSRMRSAFTNLLSIFINLSITFSSKKVRRTWLKTKHPILNKPPIKIMKEGLEGLISVQNYLERVDSR